MNMNIECARCGKSFEVNTRHLKALNLTHIPEKCPSCCDAAQNRPVEKIVVNRRMVQEWDMCQIALPPEWFKEFTADTVQGDRPAKRAIVRGSIGKGVDWDGRIDIYDFRVNPDGLGRVRLMEVEHQAGELMNVSDEDPENPDKWSNISEVRYSPIYQYLAIDPISGGTWDHHASACALIFASVYYKTTLKGHGRQFAAGIETDMALWNYRLSSRCRSGRYGNEMCIAVVDDENHVFGHSNGDVRYEKIWSLKTPYGKEI